jgi:tetratricopeptide (TPR) repeat protein
MRLGEFDNAKDSLESALSIAQSAGASRIKAMILNDLGILHDDLGDYESALNFYEMALDLHRASHYRSNEAGTLANIGYARLMIGDLEQAQSALAASIKIFELTGNRVNRATSELNLAMTELNAKKFSDSLNSAEKLAVDFKHLRAPHLQAHAMRVAGISAAHLQIFSTAQTHLRRAIDIFANLGLDSLTLESKAALAYCLALEGQTENARTLIVPISGHLAETQNVTGAEEPTRLYWHCIYTLDVCGEAALRGKLLAAAKIDLNQRADKLRSAEGRNKLIRNIPHNSLIQSLGA